MRAEIDWGGSAFPHGEIVQDMLDEKGCFVGSRVWQPSAGITLRDWFATHAKEEDIEAHIGGTVHPQTGRLYGCRTREAAKYAYADEMIRTRKGGAA